MTSKGHYTYDVIDDGALVSMVTTEQLTRLLDGLREGEAAVKHGLAEKINFEVALLKAVEASRSAPGGRSKVSPCQWSTGWPASSAKPSPCRATGAQPISLALPG